MSSGPGFLSRVVDDAALLVPTSPSSERVVERVVEQHREHRRAGCADLVGRLVVTDARLPEVAAHLDADAPLEVLVVVTGGVGALEPAVTWATRTAGLDLGGVAVRLRDEEDLAHNARRLVAMVGHLRSGGPLEESVEVLVEPPRLAHSPERGWLAALDEIAMADLTVRLRTGGADPDDRPEPAELARCLDAALDRETPIAATGRLGAVSGPGRYGVLNLLAATRVALDGGAEAVVEALTSTTPTDVADEASLVRARRWFTAGTSTDVLGLIEELVGAGVVPGGA